MPRMDLENHEISVSHSVPATPFTIRQLECFIVVAEMGSISAAAIRLRASDSAVSDALTVMERALGATLFHRRRSRGATLTSDGDAILPIARRILADAEELSGTVGRGTGAILGPVRVGAVGTIGPTLLPRIIRRVGSEHPGVRIAYRTDDLPTLLTALEDSELDAVLAFDIDVPPELNRVSLYSTEASLLVSANHRLAGRAEASLDEVAGEPMVLLDIASSRVHTLELMTSRGIHPRILHRTDNYDLCRALVGQGLGWTLLMRRDSPEETFDGGRVVMLQITPPPRRVDVLIIWSRRPLQPRLAAVIDAARRFAAPFDEPIPLPNKGRSPQ